MRHLTLAASTLLFLLTAVPLARADEPTAIDQLVAAAQIVSVDAAEVGRNARRP